MGLVAKVSADLLSAMKLRDEHRLAVLRMLKAEFQKAQADKGKSSEVTEDEALALVRRLVKQRRDAAEQYEAGGAKERAQEELSEIPLLEEYLPAQLSEEELDVMLKDAAAKTGAGGPKDMGKLMSALMQMTAGRADGKRVKEKAAAFLSAKG
ncbi:aspartyl-tRNA amidotransferase subunit B [Synergistales bacterium]|nr:aspartyl-tRNA amidotransferase subunit B [Synergistales bacterium]